MTGPPCVDLFETASGDIYVYDPLNERYGRLVRSDSTFRGDADALQDGNEVPSVSWEHFDPEGDDVDVLAFYTHGHTTVTQEPQFPETKRYLEWGGPFTHTAY